MAFKLLGLDLSLITTHRLIPVGGRLSLFIHNWEVLTRDHWVLATVRGYHLPLSRYPSQGKVPGKPMMDTIREKALAEEISSLVEKGAVAPIKKHQVRLTSPLFVVPKSGGGWRPIIDLRQLNQYIDSPHFKMEGLHMLPSLLQQEAYMAKIDLKDAYLTVPVAKDSQPFLAFQGQEGVLFQFKVLPFGLCTAPFTFTKLTKPLVQFLRRVGIHILIYLDDMLLSAQSKQQLLEHISTVIWLLASLGFVINVPKSVLTPSKQIDFLGFTINTSTMTISLPVVKKVEIQRETSQLLRCPSIQTRTLACLLGKLVATKPAVFIAPLHYRALQSLKIFALHAQQETVALSPEATDNLKWWSTQLHLHCSSPILKPEASTVITSDASLKGWGAACQERTTGGLWSTEEACFHINLLELKAAYLALQCFLKETVSTHVLMRLDNRTAIAYLNRMGGPSYSPLCQLAIDIWNWCLARQITLHAEYLPGTENTRADWESRHHHDSSNWKLCPSVFEALNYLMGPLSIDLFASRINYQLPVYCSWKPDPGARTVDAFSISWARETPYLFPPFCLIGRALSKISREAVDSACLVAPAWPSQIWYPQLLAILMGPPILLPTEDYLLLSPDQRPHPLQLEGSLCLTAWPISGNISRCKGFLQELQSSSLNHGEATPMMPTTQHGASGFAGVLNGISIPFQHL